MRNKSDEKQELWATRVMSGNNSAALLCDRRIGDRQQSATKLDVRNLMSAIKVQSERR
ncbi:MAG: hypothetical protein MH252_16540 [Thermosynechococcaceae cyanobacterium MS004]|nr:hypothetical protein [Thermosynechococcaceae cyanobacterium MS004]